MNIRTIALSGAAMLALTISAAAQESGGAASGGATSSAPSSPPAQQAPEQTYTPPPPAPPPPPMETGHGGWYLGLGAGWANLDNVKFNDNLGNTGAFNTNDGVIAVGALGYKLPTIPIRIELEGGYDWHGLSSIEVNGVSASASGHANLGHALVNGVYDIPIAPRWAISLGAGAGAAFTDFAGNTTGGLTVSRNKTDFMWQGIGGITYNVSPDVDLFVDYRYRDAMTSGSFTTPGGDIIHVHNTSENVVLAGLRWYMQP
jgi:opacity protein-like surface antigen